MGCEAAELEGDRGGTALPVPSVCCGHSGVTSTPASHTSPSSLTPEVPPPSWGAGEAVPPSRHAYLPPRPEQVPWGPRG